MVNSEDTLESIILAGGCFWCVEAIYKELKGVVSVTSGYSGGRTENPTYEEVCNGRTGHAEAIEVIFNSQILSLKEVLEIFFKTHDPTTLNRQGNDEGTQYRSAIFYNNDNQKRVCEEVKNEIENSHYYPDPIVTEITSLKKFYKAENYHQDYYKNHSNQPYCKIVIDPKIRKFRKEFMNRINIK